MLSFEHLSYWEKRAFLEGIDVCIIGSGIVGMTTAFWLKKAQPKLKILILERGYLPSGASTKNAGFACFGSPTEIADDLTINSENEVWKTVSLRYEGLRKLFEIVDSKNIKYEPCGSWDLLKNDQEISADFIDYLNEKVKIISGYEKCYSFDNQKIKSSGLKGFSKIGRAHV